MEVHNTSVRGGTARRPTSWLIVAAASLGLPCVIALMLFAFLAPTMGSGPKDLPLTIEGPAAATTGIESSLTAHSPDAFDITTSEDPGVARSDIDQRRAVGSIAVTPDGLALYTSSGNGAVYPEIMQGLADHLESSGQKVTTSDIDPVSSNDAQGRGMAMLGLPLAFGGIVSAALLTLTLKDKPGHKLVVAFAVSALGGLLAASIMHHGYGIIDANLAAEAAVIAAGVAATCLFVAGLGSHLKMPGVGIGAVIIMFLSNPLSAMPTGWWWLPSPWGEIGQYLPIGAAGSLLRSIAYFDGGGMPQPAIVLASWIAAGTALLALSWFRLRKTAAY